jgi:hypothetical protein
MRTRGGWVGILVVVAPMLAGCGLFGGGGPHRDQACLDQLNSEKVAYTVTAVKASSSACAVDNPVRISSAAMSWNPPGVLACGFAARFDDFLRDTAEPMARRRLGASITSMRDYGTYSCRRSTGSNRMSEHATGRAIDVSGFSLSNGEFVSVQHDWHEGGAKAEFLHEFARAACKRFGVILTPDANRDHYNHIHIDAGRYHLCGMRRADGTFVPLPGSDESVADKPDE